MKIAAMIFSWLGGAVTVALGYAFLIRGHVITRTYADGSTATEVIPWHGRLFVLWACYLVLLLIVLLWRQRDVSHGHKIASGICTMLFVSPIGGILTLLIPKKDLLY